MVVFFLTKCVLSCPHPPSPPPREREREREGEREREREFLVVTALLCVKAHKVRSRFKSQQAKQKQTSLFTSKTEANVTIHM